MTEPNDTQLTEGLEHYLAGHGYVDEERFGTLLTELVDQHPRRDLMCLATEPGGAIATQRVGDLNVAVHYTFHGRAWKA